MLTAAELHRRGLEASNAGRHARARTLLRKALARESDPDTVARTLVTLAHVESELGSRDEGLAMCQQALEFPGLSKQVRGLVLSQRGLLLMRAGAGHEAIEAFAEAEPFLGSDPVALTRVHLNRGNVYLQQGDARRAASDLAKAVDFADAAGLCVQRAKAEHTLGYARLLEGDIVTALRLMEANRPTLTELSPVSAAVCDQDRAEALVASGMPHDAADALRDAAAAFGSRGLRQQQGEAELILARLLSLEDSVEAIRIARRAGQRFARRGSDVWALRAESVAVASEVESGRAAQAAGVRAAELAVALRELGLAREATVLELQSARALIRANDLEGARSRISTLRTKPLPLATRMLHREVLSELALAQGRRASAIQHVRRGLADLHEWQSAFGSLDLQSSLVGHGRRLALQGLSMAVDDGRPEVVFEWSERARALASRVAPVRPPSDPKAAEDLAELRQLQLDLERAEAAGRSPRSLTARTAELRRRIRQRAWYDEGSRLVTQPVALDEMVHTLSSTSGVLVSYLVSGEHLHALVATGGGARVHHLGSITPVRELLEGLQADLDMAAAHLPAAVRSAVRAGLQERLARLSALLVTPLDSMLGEGRLVIVPSGWLAGVPWTMLPGLVGRPLTVPRSASSWLEARAGIAPADAAGFVAGPRVARAEEEVHKSASAWPRAALLTGNDATAATVSELAHGVEVLHVAAHGRHSADNPLFSGIELVDGPWFGYDIDQVGDIPSTVILSACELGRSSVRWGEETIGMTVAWLHAGARTVIASPALVDDDVACDVLAATHVGLARGDLPADALAAATADFTGESASPFICFGSGF